MLGCLHKLQCDMCKVIPKGPCVIITQLLLTISLRFSYCYSIKTSERAYNLLVITQENRQKIQFFEISLSSWRVYKSLETLIAFAAYPLL